MKAIMVARKVDERILENGCLASGGRLNDL